MSKRGPARAGALRFSLAVGDEVVLTVTDDGTGHVDGGPSSGLRNMTERAEALGGRSRYAGRETTAGLSLCGGSRPLLDAEKARAAALAF